MQNVQLKRINVLIVISVIIIFCLVPLCIQFNLQGQLIILMPSLTGLIALFIYSNKEEIFYNEKRYDLKVEAFKQITQSTEHLMGLLDRKYLNGRHLSIDEHNDLTRAFENLLKVISANKFLLPPDAYKKINQMSKQDREIIPETGYFSFEDKPANRKKSNQLYSEFQEIMRKNLKL